jgi:hypothetical protein
MLLVPVVSAEELGHHASRDDSVTALSGLDHASVRESTQRDIRTGGPGGTTVRRGGHHSTAESGTASGTACEDVKHREADKVGECHQRGVLPTQIGSGGTEDGGQESANEDEVYGDGAGQPSDDPEGKADLGQLLGEVASIVTARPALGEPAQS